MSFRIHTRLFAHHADAAAALHDLGVAGFTENEASLLGGHAARPGEGLARPGGLQAGSSAAPSGQLRFLIEAGVEEREARGLAEGLERGGTLVILRADEARSERGGTILANHVAVHEGGSVQAAAGPEGQGVLSAPAPGTPGNPPGA